MKTSRFIVLTSLWDDCVVLKAEMKLIRFESQVLSEALSMKQCEGSGMVSEVGSEAMTCLITIFSMQYSFRHTMADICCRYDGCGLRDVVVVCVDVNELCMLLINELMRL